MEMMIKAFHAVAMSCKSMSCSFGEGVAAPAAGDAGPAATPEKICEGQPGCRRGRLGKARRRYEQGVQGGGQKASASTVRVRLEVRTIRYMATTDI